MIITESVIVLTLMLVSVLDAVITVTLKNHKKQLLECSLAVIVCLWVLGVMTIAVPTTWLATNTFVLVCMLRMYNSYYSNASEDELVEGIFWPRFREWALSKMEHITID